MEMLLHLIFYFFFSKIHSEQSQNDLNNHFPINAISRKLKKNIFHSCIETFQKYCM